MSHPETIARFAVIRQVGTGGMGTVYEALDPQIDRRVALKVLRRDVLTQNPELIERLWVEARAANGIRHPGVVQVSEAHLLPDGTGFLVMEFLDGPTLTQRLKQSGGALPVSQALQIAIQIASTLSAGHQKGIIHRDLKPDNVILVSDDAVVGGERVKLLDFGIAKIANAAAASAPLTLNDMGLGTPGYMAPEQMRDAANASDRSDVYGLGAVLFEMVAGRRPHVAPNAAELIVTVLSQDAPPLTGVVSEAPPPLSTLVGRMLQREPASARPPIVEVLRELILLNGMLAAQAALRSGPFLTLDPSQVSGHFTPPAMVRSEGALAVVSGQHAFAEKMATPSGARPMAPPPSASTISQMSGQTSPPDEANPGTSRRMALALTALGTLVLGSVVLTGIAGWKQKGKREAPAAAVSDAAVSAVAPGSFPPVEPISSLTVPPPPTAPPKLAKEKVEAPASQRSEAAAPSIVHPTKPVLTQGTVPTAACILGAGLSRSARQDIATVFSKAGIQLLPGESVYLIRQGDGLEIDKKPASISRKQEANLARMLGTALSKNALPANLEGVHVRCDGK